MSAAANLTKETRSAPHLGRHQDRFVQHKLEIGQPDDKFEKEADAVADRVMMKPDSRNQAPPMEGNIVPVMQMKSTGDSEIQIKCEEEESIQMKPTNDLIMMASAPDDEDEPIQLKALGGAIMRVEEEEEMIQMKPDIQKSDNGKNYVSSDVSSQIMRTKGSGQSIAPNVSAEMGSKIGADFSGVKIHTGSTSAQMNQAIGAQAFTHGSDIFFNQYKYNPDTKSGKHLLAHELTHTIQQKGMIQKRVQKTSNFCKPYATTAEAVNAEWWLRNTYMRLEGIETFGTEVYNLYDSFLNRSPGDSLTPRIFNSSSSYIHNSFKDDGYIKDDMDEVLELVNRRLHRAPRGSIREGVRSVMSLSNFLSVTEMNNRPINFSNPFSVSGHIAGDIGSSDAGPDSRKITRANVAITKVVLFGNTGYHLIELIPHYEVFDTIDFCPGDPGSPAESLITTPMSRLEASGAAYDMPFKVIFSPDPRSERFWF